MLLNHPALQFLPLSVREEVILNLDKNDRAHQQEHVKAVVDFAVELAKKVNLTPKETRKLLTAAFMHDIACHVDRDTHEIIGAEKALGILVGTKGFIPASIAGFDVFDLCDIKIMILEHRASYLGERTMLTSKLMRLADMGKLDKDRFGMRAIYHRFDGYTREACVNEATEHLHEKFSTNGYAWKSYPDIGYELYGEEIARIKVLSDNVEGLRLYLDGCYEHALGKGLVPAV